MSATHEEQAAIGTHALILVGYLELRSYLNFPGTEHEISLAEKKLLASDSRPAEDGKKGKKPKKEKSEKTFNQLDAKFQITPGMDLNHIFPEELKMIEVRNR